MQNKELAKELHKPIIKNFEKKKVHSSFIDKIQDAYFVDMQLVSKLNKEFRFLLCFIDIYNKSKWVIPSQDKKDTPITNGFSKN